MGWLPEWRSGAWSPQAVHEEVRDPHCGNQSTSHCLQSTWRSTATLLSTPHLTCNTLLRIALSLHLRRQRASSPPSHSASSSHRTRRTSIWISTSGTPSWQTAVQLGAFVQDNPAGCRLEERRLRIGGCGEVQPSLPPLRLEVTSSLAPCCAVLTERMTSSSPLQAVSETLPLVYTPFLPFNAPSPAPLSNGVNTTYPSSALPADAVTVLSN